MNAVYFIFKLICYEQSYENLSVIFQWRMPSWLRGLYIYNNRDIYQTWKFFWSASEHFSQPLPPSHITNFMSATISIQAMRFPLPWCHLPPTVTSPHYLLPVTTLQLLAETMWVNQSVSPCWSCQHSHLLPPHLHGIVLHQMHAQFCWQRNVCQEQVTCCWIRK